MSAQTDTMASLVELVAHGLGVALLPPLAVSDTQHVATLRTEPTIRRELAAITAAGRPPTPAAAALLDLMTPTAPPAAPEHHDARG